MQRRKLVITLLIVVAGVIGWALFRPERLFVNAKVNETFPTTAKATTTTAEPQLLAAGRFHGVAHEGKGQASVYQLQDGKRVLRLTEFETSNGPDVHVYLVAANDATDSDTVKKAGFVEISPLKGNVGDQNYELPAEVDLSKYRAVTIWCQRFGVNFATAPLSSGMMSAGTGEPQSLVSGRFHSVAHDGAGVATVYRLADGQRVLRLSQFSTSNGPDLQLYLVAAGDASDSETVKKAGFVTLGALKGNQGDQNYLLPADVDLSKYRAVTVWCRRFGVNFATAPLGTQQAMANRSN